MDQDKRKVLTVKWKITIAAIAVLLVFAVGSYSTSLRYMKTSEVESKLHFGMTKTEVFEALSVSERAAHHETTRQYDEGVITFVRFWSDYLSAVIPQVEYTFEFMEGRLVGVHAYEVHFVEENGRYLDLQGTPEGYDPPWSQSEIKPDMSEFASEKSLQIEGFGEQAQYAQSSS